MLYIPRLNVEGKTPVLPGTCTFLPIIAKPNAWYITLDNYEWLGTTKTNSGGHFTRPTPVCVRYTSRLHTACMTPAQVG